MANLQKRYDKSGGKLELRPDEYKGPLVVNRPGVVDGRGATIWADAGPVIQVKSRGVTLRNLRVETMNDSTDASRRTAILTKAPDTIFDNVEVYGDVSGPVQGAGKTEVPRTVNLGTFAADEVSSFSVPVTLPAPARVRSGVDGLHAEPKEAGPGKTELYIETEPLPDGTNLYGEIFLDGDVKRRIYVRGCARSSARKHTAPRPQPRAAARKAFAPQQGSRRPAVQQQSPERRPAPQQSQQKRPPAPAAARGPAPPVPSSQPAASAARPHLPQNRSGSSAAGGIPKGGPVSLQRGERRPLGALADETLVVRCHLTRKAEVDPYVFALGKDGKVSGDEDFVFFGNPRLGNTDAAQILEGPEAPAVAIRLSSAEQAVDRLVVAFSEYADPPGAGGTGALRGVSFTVNAEGQEVYTFSQPHTAAERTIVALEFYRYKGEWRLRCVDSGLNAGIHELCTRYGVELT